MRFGERAQRLAGVAARVLGWKPDEFWTATPMEMASALTGDEAVEPVEGDELRALMARYPDGMD